METSEFKELYIWQGLDKEILKKTLSGNVRLTEKEVLLEPGIKPVKKAIIMFLLGNKVLKLDGLKEIEAVGVTEIAEHTSIPGGTVRPNLRELFEEGYVKQTQDGKYYVPDHLLLKIHELFGHKK